MQSKKAMLVSAAIVLLICVPFYFFNGRLALGTAAGYFTGVLNFFLISVSVKRMFRSGGATGAKVGLAVFSYFSRLMLSALIIAAVVAARKTYSIAGFVAGFTLSVAVMLAVHRIYKEGN
jgi:hypothetical protein